MGNFRASSKIEEYHDHKAANEGIEAEEIAGWTPQSITTHRDGWGDTSSERVLVLYRASEALPRTELLNMAVSTGSAARAARDVLFDPSSEPLSVDTLIELTHSNSFDTRERAFKALFSRDRPVLTRAQAIELTKGSNHELAEAAAQWLLEN